MKTATSRSPSFHIADSNLCQTTSDLPLFLKKVAAQEFANTKCSYLEGLDYGNLDNCIETFKDKRGAKALGHELALFKSTYP